MVLQIDLQYIHSQVIQLDQTKEGKCENSHHPSAQIIGHVCLNHGIAEVDVHHKAPPRTDECNE